MEVEDRVCKKRDKEHTSTIIKFKCNEFYREVVPVVVWDEGFEWWIFEEYLEKLPYYLSEDIPY